LQGSYYNNFTDNNPRRFIYTYDNSNRLLTAAPQTATDSTYKLVNGYDGDGNLKLLKRHDAQMNIADNLNYDYYTGTNKLQKVTGSVQQFTYDLNGNVTGDSLNHLYSFKYDYRNLLTEFRRWEQVSTMKGTVLNVYMSRYYYDEAGSRIDYIVAENNTADYTSLGTKYSGYTFFSGSHPNTEPGTLLSISNNNEIFYNKDLSDMAITKTLAHEMYIHAYHYMNEERYGHAQNPLPDDPIEKESHELDIKTEENFIK
jgi:hypothetical protein